MEISLLEFVFYMVISLTIIGFMYWVGYVNGRKDVLTEIKWRKQIRDRNVIRFQKR